MKQQRTKLSLHMSHPTRDLAVVCDALGFKPAVLWKADEERRTPKGNWRHSRGVLLFDPFWSETTQRAGEANARRIGEAQATPAYLTRAGVDRR